MAILYRHAILPLNISPLLTPLTGILGLDSLLFFAHTYPRAAQRVCNESLVPNLKW